MKNIMNPIENCLVFSKTAVKYIINVIDIMKNVTNIS